MIEFNLNMEEALNRSVITVIEMVNSFFQHLPFIVVGLIIIFISLMAGRAVMKTVSYAGEKIHMDETLAKLFSEVSKYLTIIIGCLIAAVVVFPDFSPGKIVTGLGLTSVAVGFAFKDILENFFAGVVILWSKPFKVGDQIVFNNVAGNVRTINIRTTEIKTFDGELTVIPNAQMLSNPITVYTDDDKRRIRFSVGIAYDQPIEKTRTIITDILSSTEGVLKNPAPWVYVDEFADSSVNFIVYYWTSARQDKLLETR